MIESIASTLFRFFIIAVSALLISCGAEPLDNTQTLECPGNRVIGDEQTLQSLAGCTSIQGNLSISNVVSLAALSHLQKVEGDLVIGFRHQDHDTPEGPLGLTDLSGLEKLTNITGSLQIARNSVLQSLQGLDNLASLGGNLIIGTDDLLKPFGYEIQNPQLKEIDALWNLTQVHGDLVITYSTSLESLEGLANVRVIEGSIIIIPNPGFQDVIPLRAIGLKALEAVGGDFLLSGDSLLETLDGLETLHTVGGKFNISYHSKLTDINALQNLKEVGGLVDISSNPRITEAQVAQILAQLD